MPNDLKTLWQKATQAAHDQAIVDGLLGRTGNDSATDIAVTGRSGYVYVRLKNQTVIIARNEAGVPLTADLAVKVRREHGSYTVLGRSFQGPLAVATPVPSSGVVAHATTHQHGGDDEVATASPAANAIPKADASGKLATGWYDTAAAIHAADAKTTPVDDDELGLVDSAASNVLKKLTWSNVKATLKSYFDTLYFVLAGKSGGQTANGGTGSGDNLTLNSTAHATKGKILFGSHSAFDQANGRWGFGTQLPALAVQVVVSAVNNTRERFARFEVSDAGNAALFLFNQTSANNGLLPAVGGMSDGATRQSLDLAGYITSAMDTGTVPVVRFNANITTDAADPPNGTLSAVSVRPLFEWANSGTQLASIDANGVFNIGTGFGTLPSAVPNPFLTAIRDVNNVIGLIAYNPNTGTAAETRIAVYDTTKDAYIAFTMGGDGKTGTLLGLNRNATSYIFTNSATNARAFAIGTVDSQPLVFGTSNAERVRIDDDGKIGVNVTSPQGRFHVHDGVSGWLFVTKTGIGASAQTIIPNGTGDVTGALWGSFMLSSSGGIFSGGTLTSRITPGNSETIGAGFALDLRVNADGSVDIRRVSGSDTWTANLFLQWI